MKNIFKYILLLIPILTFSQNFKIAEPNVTLLKKEMERINSEDAIYIFFTHNYDSISKKRNIIHYDYPDYSICSFNQDFEYGINYSILQCGEAGGASISLVLPKTERKSLTKWIEGIFNSYEMDIENKWNSDKSIYGPTNKGAGCYFEIKETEKNTIVENYCGC